MTISYDQIATVASRIERLVDRGDVTLAFNAPSAMLGQIADEGRQMQRALREARSIAESVNEMSAEILNNMGELRQSDNQMNLVRFAGRMQGFINEAENMGDSLLRTLLTIGVTEEYLECA